MRKNWLTVLSVPFILLLVAGAAWSATNSGANSFKVYIDTNSTTLGGDSINIAINVLNEAGAVNTTSNGNTGDVLFEITTQLGEGNWLPTGGGLYNGNASTEEFQAEVYQYMQPQQGRIYGPIEYNDVSGTDTIVVNMFEAVAAGGGDNPAAVVPGNLLQSESFDITVGQGNPEVNNLAIYVGTDAGGDLAPDNIAMENSAAAYKTLFGETLQGVRAADGFGTAEVTNSNAGVDFGLHVRARTGAAVDKSVTGATAKVYFAKLSKTPTSKVKIYNTDNPEGVEELEVTLTDGEWNGIVSLRDSGNFLPVVYQDHDDGSRAIAVQKSVVNADNGIVLHHVNPKGTCTSMTLAAGTTAVEDDPTDTANTDDDIAKGFTISLFDTYGNACPAPAGGLTATFSATPDGAVDNLAIAAGATSATTPTAGSVNLPNNIGTWSVTAAIPTLGLTSNTVSLKVVQDGLDNDFAGNQAVLWVDDDGNNNGTRVYTAGQEINIWLDKNFVEGATSYVGATAYLGSATATIQKTEQAVYGVDQDTDAAVETEDYICSFPVTSAGAGKSFMFGIQGDPVAPVYFGNGKINQFAGILGGAGTVLGTVQAITVNPAAAASYFYMDYTGTEQTTYDLQNGADFTLRGQRAQFKDSHGNNIDPDDNVNYFSGLSSAGANAFDLAGADLKDWGPSVGTKTNVGLNGGVTAGSLFESVRVEFDDDVADDSDTLSAVMSTTASDSYAFTLLNIGNPFTQIKVSSNSGVTDTIQMPQNGVIPVLVETLDANDNRLPSDGADLLFSISNTNLDVTNDTPNPSVGLNAGDEFDTVGGNGRTVLRVEAGASTGETTIKVQTKDGSIESNTLTIDVQTIAPDLPEPVDEITAGQGSIDPADVTATVNDTVDLYVFTDIDGFTPTACWVTLNIEGTNYYWVYDEANSAWKRFNFVAEGHEDYDANFPTLTEAITDYPFTATGADQQVGNNLPMTGLSGLVFNVTFWYFDADGALQTFDYTITVTE